MKMLKVFYKKDSPKNSAKITVEHQCWGFFSIKLLLQALQHYEEKHKHTYFPVNFARHSRTPIL